MSDLETGVLKGVSRSFYLTLRLLPAPMRRAASLGYLLARTSDTIADTEGVPVEERLRLLSAYEAAITRREDLDPAYANMIDATHRIGLFELYGTALEAESRLPGWPAELLSAADPKETILLEKAREVVTAFYKLPEAEQTLVREVLEIIISGQQNDLEKFSRADGTHPIALSSDAELEDYTWRVAGCVGAFWTKLGFLTLGESFSTSSREELLERGIAYGKGLQLVNILRDLPRDLAAGRCYLPVPDVSNRSEMLRCHARWLRQAESWVRDGEAYARSLPIRRLRAATVLPAWLAAETLEKLKGITWEQLQQRVKVPRRRVYALLLKAWWW